MNQGIIWDLDGVIVDSPFHFEAWGQFAAAGIEAAKGAGMKSIGVTNTLPREKLASADQVVRSLEELDLKMIARLLI
jgi:beta-phosphoglucomutase-like phosphatase (HAD superfamily)